MYDYRVSNSVRILWAASVFAQVLCCLTVFFVLGSIRPYFRVNHALEREMEARVKYEQEAARAALLEQENAELRRRLSEVRP